MEFFYEDRAEAVDRFMLIAALCQELLIDLVRLRQGAIDLPEHGLQVVGKGGAGQRFHLGAEKMEGHQLRQGEGDGGDILETGEKAVQLLTLLPIRNQRVPGLLDGDQVPLDGAPCNARLLGKLLEALELLERLVGVQRSQQLYDVSLVRAQLPGAGPAAVFVQLETRLVRRLFRHRAHADGLRRRTVRRRGVVERVVRG